MKRVIFLTTRDARFGFSLAGVQQLVVEPWQAEETLRKAIADENIAVVAIDERLAQKIPEKLFSDLEAAWRGLIVTLPAPERSEGAVDDRLQRLIRRALGYHVRLHL